MLVLFETAAGFAVFKLLNEKKLENVDNLAKEFTSPEGAANIVQLKNFHKFKDSAEALQAAVAINEGAMCKSLKSVIKKVLKKECHDKLMVIDAKLGLSIKDKLPDLKIVSNSSVLELIRCIRGQMESLIPGISEKENAAMMLGLGHNLARYKLKFSPDKVDTMVIQAVNLMGDLDKELNNYVMRAKEWYGWHFPELAKILTDNTAYINTILKMGYRVNARNVDFDTILSPELSERVKEAAEVSMGCEISPNDLAYMQGLCEQILSFTEYRAHLGEYLETRMKALAPNLTMLIGNYIGAKLIAHTGSLINLAKAPASTVQLIGAEKALFRALKTKSNTPKYGLIYHAELVNRAVTKNKGRMSRMLAAKAVLSARVDALSEESSVTIGTVSKQKLEYASKCWESGKVRRISKNNKGAGNQGAYIPEMRAPGAGGRGFGYQSQMDNTIGQKRQRDDEATEAPAQEEPKKRVKTDLEETEEAAAAPTGEKKKKKKKDKKKEVKEEEEVAAPQEEAEPEAPVSEKKKKKKKDKKHRAAE